MNWWTIYWVSVLDGLSGVFSVVATVTIVANVLLAIVVGVAYCFGTMDGDEDAATFARAGGRVLKWATVAAFLFGLGAALTPTTHQLVRAYVMVEGSKVVNAKNAETATKEILKRVDKLIEQIGGTP